MNSVMVLMLFFFKQKTAYEMRISDWSSDVCSSDLDRSGGRGRDGKPVGIDELRGKARLAPKRHGKAAVGRTEAARFLHQPHRHADIAHAIGRLDDLDEDAPRRGDRLVHIPQRAGAARSEEHTSELQSPMRHSL